ncbi:MAG TPA: TonB-dependent receptor [Chitinophagaceae bacterium]|nr:TonB-dependent receptor [Chitinophagaceae bacterium]
MKKRMPRYFLCLISLLLCCLAFSQKKSAVVTGRVLDENEQPLAGVSVIILGRQSGTSTGDSGQFRIRVPADRAFALVFSHTGYSTRQQNFLLSSGEQETITLRLEPSSRVLSEVVVTDQRDRREAGLIHINPKNILNLPSPVTGVESLIKVFVGSNNELTSQYSVRGGNFDENLIYVNDFEVFRPYLVSNAQQEGLSFINPELVRNISFYTGGFQARYGDKMSSVLDIQYKKPQASSGSAYLGLLEQGLHLEGLSRNRRFTYLVGARSRTNRNLLSSQETKGNYVPASADLQALLTYQLNGKWQAEFLGNFSQTRFSLEPQSSQLTSSVFSPFFSANLGLDIQFQGQEKDRYSTGMMGLSLTNQVNRRLKIKWLASRFEDNEQQNEDITGAYLFGERDFDKSNPTFGLIVNPLGAGINQNYSRDRLDIVNWNLSNRGTFDQGRQVWLWGVGIDRTLITDHLNEWEYQDSAGYSLPYNPDLLQLNGVLRSREDLQVTKLSGYIQDNLALGDSGRAFTLQAGLRYNYNSLNREFFLSPRLGASWKPAGRRDIVLRASLGSYNQPPFYREMRRYDGTLNTALRSQKSWQAVAGMDLNFRGWDRPMRLTTEAYYKYMTDVDVYDIDNVRIRYFGNNQAKAYAAGVEMRLFGELVKDAESWVSLGLMRTRENLDGDTYQVYTLDSLNRPVDSSTVQGGWFRRPTDRLITFGMFFQDYLSTNKNFKVYVNGLYGSNLPYNIPGSIRYRNALVIEPYIRVDIGFSALLLDAERSNRRSHSPFRNFENIWATLEVFNLIDRANTISYQLVKDFSNTTYTIPNRLTPRLLNFKIIARW